MVYISYDLYDKSPDDFYQLGIIQKILENIGYTYKGISDSTLERNGIKFQTFVFKGLNNWGESILHIKFENNKGGTGVSKRMNILGYFKLQKTVNNNIISQIDPTDFFILTEIMIITKQLKENTIGYLCFKDKNAVHKLMKLNYPYRDSFRELESIIMRDYEKIEDGKFVKNEKGKRTYLWIFKLNNFIHSVCISGMLMENPHKHKLERKLAHLELKAIFNQLTNECVIS